MSLSKQVNNSGFPLQLALSSLVKKGETYWTVLYEEHAWEKGSRGGFIDLVLEDPNKTWLMNVECKRVRESSWIFLKDMKNNNTRPHAKIWVTKIADSSNSLKQFGWVDVPMSPDCHESSICVVPGQGPKDRPMLERVASEVVMSTEALAEEEAINLTTHYSHLRIYQNVIVTTAKLKVAEIDVDVINLATGEIDENTKFSEVPFIRFRKQIGGLLPNVSDVVYDRDLRKLVLSKESTVFVVNAESFLDFINSCDIDDDIAKYIHGR